MTGLSSKTWTTLSAKPGFPKKTENGYDVAACLEWKAANVKDRAPSGSLTDLKGEKLKEEVRLLRLKSAAQERKLIDRDEVRRLLLNISTRQRTILYEKFESDLPPKLDGQPATEARRLLQEAADSICDAMAGLVEEFEGA